MGRMMPPTRMLEEEEEEEEQGLDSSSCGLFRELHRAVNCIDRGRILVASTGREIEIYPHWCTT